SIISITAKRLCQISLQLSFSDNINSIRSDGLRACIVKGFLTYKAQSFALQDLEKSGELFRAAI
ncbi:hypothetical protein A3010_22970, partial [Salmonella enterica subsp. enterica serovar Bredeney]|nr:hypothetical protein [Salmonella enterica subsp. enterica serovar Bredeney]